MADLTPAQAALMSSYAVTVAQSMAAVCIVLDKAHEDGLALPPSIVQAVDRIEALTAAWELNARGLPITPELRTRLDLPPQENPT